MLLDADASIVSIVTALGCPSRTAFGKLTGESEGLAERNR
jgi:hypothetical protein